MDRYYYLKGSERVGPVSEDQLINLNLDLENLVWKEGIEKWTALKDIQSLIGSFPPPVPNALSIVETRRKTDDEWYKSTLIFVFILSIAVATSYLALEAKKRTCERELTARITNLLGNNSKVSSANFWSPIGKLKKVVKPAPYLKRSEHSDFLNRIFYDSELEQYNNDIKSGIISRFLLERGGFVYLELGKEDEGYELTTITSKNLTYRKIPGIPSYGNDFIPEAYNRGLQFYKTENKYSFDEDKFIYLQNFPSISNKLYKIENKPNSLTAHWRSEGQASVAFLGYSIDVKILKYFYKVELNRQNYEEMLIWYLAIAFCSSLILLPVVLHLLRIFRLN